MARKKAAKASSGSRRAAAPAAVAQIEDVEDVGGGLSIEDGISITTFIALAVALTMVIMVMGRYP